MAAPAHIARANGKKGGRKKGYKAIEAEKSREYLVKRIASELDPIVTAQIEAAKGIWLEQTNDDGDTVRVYKKAPDTKAGEYLLNQAVGKPKETVEVIKDIELKVDF